MAKIKGRNASFFRAIEDEAMALQYHDGRGIIFQNLDAARAYERSSLPEHLRRANEAWMNIKAVVKDPKLRARIDGRIKLNEQKSDASGLKRA
ncbi:MAG: hypothetical protein KGH72_00105 [Candidatus Micrarchaeota archaeon]|nr:hypothetical protein [Candidatus Micrarchaeota archaeon]